MKTYLPLVATITLLALGAVTSLAQPTVSTGQSDYPPGATVNSTGSSFQPGLAPMAVLGAWPELALRNRFRISTGDLFQRSAFNSSFTYRHCSGEPQATI